MGKKIGLEREGVFLAEGNVCRENSVLFYVLLFSSVAPA